MDTLVCRAELKEKLNGNSRDSGGNNNREAFQLQPSASQGVIRIHTQVQQETDTIDPSALDRKYAPEDVESDRSYSHSPPPALAV